MLNSNPKHVKVPFLTNQNIQKRQLALNLNLMSKLNVTMLTIQVFKKQWNMFYVSKQQKRVIHKSSIETGFELSGINVKPDNTTLMGAKGEPIYLGAS